MVAICTTVANLGAAPMTNVTSQTHEPQTEVESHSTTISHTTLSQENTPQSSSILSRAITTSSLTMISTPTDEQNKSTMNTTTTSEKLTSTSISALTSATSYVPRMAAVHLNATHLKDARRYSGMASREAMCHFNFLARKYNLTLANPSALVDILTHGVTCPHLPANIVDQARNCTNQLEVLGQLLNVTTVYMVMRRFVATSQYRQSPDYIWTNVRSLKAKLQQLIEPFGVIISARATTTLASLSSSPRDLVSVMGRLAHLSQEMNVVESALRALGNC